MLRHITAFTLATMAAASLSLAAADAVQIQLRGKYYVSPATVQIIVAVEPNERNRMLRLEADGEGMYRSTEIPLAGASEKRLHTVQFKNLTGGAYVLRAEIFAEGDRMLAMAEDDLIVSGR